MKHRRLALAMIVSGTLATLFLASLPGSGQEKKAQDFTSELFPLRVGHRWTYLATDGKERVVVTVEKQEPIKRKVKVEDRDRIETLDSYFLRITSGDKSVLEQVFVTEDGVYRYAAAGKEI